MPPAVVQLNCARCTTRKLKCDKGSPCSACQRAGIQCEAVARPRLPRGRNGGRKTASSSLKPRLQRLESLVQSLMPEKYASTSLGESAEPRNQQSPSGRSDSDTMERYIGGRFWDALSQEVQGIRDILDQSSDDDEEIPPPETNDNEYTPQRSLFDFVLTAPGLFMSAPDALEHPPPAFADRLASVFIVRVHPIVKILHAVRVRDMANETSLLSQTNLDDPGAEALKFAIYYSAVNTLDDSECMQHFQQPKAGLMYRFRFALEVLLSKANFVTTEDVRVLQAFMILIVAVRTINNSRWSWTLAALATRIARAMMLHSETACASYGPYEAELRRRLWNNVYVMDLQFAFDRAADPLIEEGTYTTKPLSNVDEISTGLGVYDFSEPKRGLTDSSWAILQREAAVLSKRLNFVRAHEAAQRPFDLEQYWQDRINVAEEFKRNMHDRFEQYLNSDGPLEVMMRQGLGVVTGSMMIIAVRPMQRHPTVPPPTIGSSTILRIALGVLEQANVSSWEPALQAWKWYFWIQWHPLAVAIAELCAKDHGAVADLAWPIVQNAYDSSSKNIADSDRGLLWRPIRKLMRKAKAQTRIFELERQNRVLREVSPAKRTIMPQSTAFPVDVVSPGTTLPALPEPFHAHDIDSQFTFSGGDFSSYNFDTLDLDAMNWSLEDTADAWTEWNTFMDEFGGASGVS